MDKNLIDLQADLPESSLTNFNISVKFERKLTDTHYQISDETAQFFIDLTNYKHKNDIQEGLFYKCYAIRKYSNDTLKAGPNSYILNDKARNNSEVYINTAQLISMAPYSNISGKIILKVLQKYESKTVPTKYGDKKQRRVLVGDQMHKTIITFWGVDGNKESNKLEEGSVYYFQELQLENFPNDADRYENY